MGSSASVSDCSKIFNDTPLPSSSLDFDPTYQVKTPEINPTDKDAPGKCLATSKWIITLQGTNTSHLGKRKIMFNSAIGWDLSC